MLERPLWSLYISAPHPKHPCVTWMVHIPSLDGSPLMGDRPARACDNSDGRRVAEVINSGFSVGGGVFSELMGMHARGTPTEGGFPSASRLRRNSTSTSSPYF